MGAGQPLPGWGTLRTAIMAEVPWIDAEGASWSRVSLEMIERIPPCDVFVKGLREPPTTQVTVDASMDTDAKRMGRSWQQHRRRR